MKSPAHWSSRHGNRGRSFGNMYLILYQDFSSWPGSVSQGNRGLTGKEGREVKTGRTWWLMDLLGEGKRLRGSHLAVWLVAQKVMVPPFTKRGNTGEDSCLGTGEKLDSGQERITRGQGVMKRRQVDEWIVIGLGEVLETHIWKLTRSPKGSVIWKDKSWSHRQSP